MSETVNKIPGEIHLIEEYPYSAPCTGDGCQFCAAQQGSLDFASSI